MTVFILTPIVPWTDQFNTVHTAIVRAADETRARAMVAAKAALFEGQDVWLKPELTKCVPLTGDGPAEVILTEVYGI